MNAYRIRRLAFGGLLTALIAALTAYVRIGIPGGYLNPGDCAAALAAVLLGPYAAVPAALGSAMADLLGYPQYALFTLVIKGLMGLIAGYGLRCRGKAAAALGIAASGVILVGGYFCTDVLLGGAGMAVADLMWNVLQFILFAVSAVFFRAVDVKKYMGGGKN